MSTAKHTAVALAVAVVSTTGLARADHEALPDAKEEEAPEKGAKPKAEPKEKKEGDEGDKAEKKEEAPAELSVVGSKEAETGGSVHALKQKQLERFRYDDPHAVFVSVPGVYARTEDGFGLRPNIGMRGASSDRSKKVTLMEDGVLFGPAPYSAPAAYYFPLVGRMRAVHIVKGPSAILYGPQTIGGAVDLVTADVPSSPTGRFGLTLGSYGFHQLFARQGLSIDDVGLLAEVVQLGSDGFKVLDAGGDTGFLRREAMVKGVFGLPGREGLRHELGIKLTLSTEVSNESYLGLTDADFRATPYRRYLASQWDRMENLRTSVVVRHEAHFAGGFDLTTSVYRHDYHRVWRKVNGVRGGDISQVLAQPDAPGNVGFYRALTGQADSAGIGQAILIGPNDRRFVSQGVQTVGRKTWKGDGWENRLEYGLRVHYDEIARNQQQNGFLMQSGRLVADGRPVEMLDDNRQSTTALALHLADAFAFSRFVVTPGLRVEMLRGREDDYLAKTTSVNTMSVFLPGLGLFARLTPNLGLVAGVHRGFSPPTPGASKVTSFEDAIHWEGGARWTSRRVRAEVIGFYDDYRNLTDICTFSNGCIGKNQDRQYDAGAARIMGAEAFVDTEIPVAKDAVVPLRLSYTFTRTELLSSFVSSDPQLANVKEGDELPYVPRHQVSAMLGFETKRFGISAQGLYVGRMRETAGQGDYVEGLTTDKTLTLDVSGSVKITPWLKVHAGVRNLFDQAVLAARRPFGARPLAPRMMQMGLQVDL